jgi:penicillin-insensitive murein endopeptidase
MSPRRRLDRGPVVSDSAGMRMIRSVAVTAFIIAGLFTGASAAGERAPPSPNAVAKEVFGRAKQAADLAPRAIGFYSRGCLAGARALPVNGATWQVMRLSRNRNWGHPDLIALIERLAKRAPAVGWPGLLVGDISQPRGGPMLTGHASHQIGLDADIWLTPMPDRTLSREERETISATSMVADDWNDVDPSKWTPAHTAIIRAAALERGVERIFVNAAIKKALCRDAGRDRAWLNKVRPYWGHNYHFHIRIACPQGQPGCRDQDAVPAGDGCDASLDWWFSEEARRPPKTPPKPRPPMTMAQLPPECGRVAVAD